MTIRQIKTIKDVPLTGKRVLIRVDFNVPIDADGNITDDSRICAALPTLKYALDQQARLIIASHLGRPEGKVASAFSLSPVADGLGELLQRKVRMAPDCVGSETTAMAGSMDTGDILMLENLRFHPGESENNDDYARKLASLCDIYVNDAFAVSHRANASVEAITKHVSASVAGFLLQIELEAFDRMIANPKHPFAAIVGGSKVSGKLEALLNMLGTVDTLIIGGAMANTFLNAMGIDVGGSKVENGLIDAAKSIMDQAAGRNIKFCLPVDVIAARHFEPDSDTRIVSVQEIPSDWMALDIGPATSRLFSEALADAETIVWNGPMGVFEMDAYSAGTMAIAGCVAESNAITIAGGGDTDAALHKSGYIGKMTYVSTGGGAFLTLLEGKMLPAVAALHRAGSHIETKSDNVR